MTEQVPNAFSDAHAVWHAEVEAARAAPYGPLSWTALHWLTSEPRELAGLPGRWHATPDGVVTVLLRDTDDVLQAGNPVSGQVLFGPLRRAERASLAWGTTHIDIAVRAGKPIVRPHDPESRLRMNYRGTPIFPPDPSWVIESDFEVDPRSSVALATAAGDDLIEHFESPGRAVFRIDGEEHRVTLFGSLDAGDLRVMFTDASPESFDRVRVAPVGKNGEGRLVIDFTRAVNSACAYTPYAICPMPPPENHLPVAIEAGERKPVS